MIFFFFVPLLVSQPWVEINILNFHRWRPLAFGSWTRGSLVFYYSSDKTKAAHELALENYGADGTWAILVKAEI